MDCICISEISYMDVFVQINGNDLKQKIESQYSSINIGHQN